MAFLIIVLCLTLPIFFFFLFQRNTKIGCFPPGPWRLPFIGNLHQFDSVNPHIYLYRISKKYGPIMSLRLGFRPTLVVSSAKMAKEILKTHDLQFCSRPPLLCQKMLSYNGKDVAFSPYNDYWREIRKIWVANLFNYDRSQDFHPIRKEEVSRMVEKISKSDGSVNLSEMMMFLSSTIIFRLGFGKRYEDGATERSRIHVLLNETQVLLKSFFFSDYFPYMRWLDKLTGMIARLEKNFKELDAFYTELIDDNNNPNRPKNKQEGIIDVLLQIRKEHGFKFDLTSDHIKAVLMNVFVGSIDSSAATVVWVMTLLMKNPKELRKVQEEIRFLVGEKDYVDEDDIQMLPFLKAVVKETMRLQPPGPLLIPRQTMEKCIIDGYEIPAKSLVFVNAFAVGRDPEAWDSPDVFNPNRFIGSPIDMKGQHYELIPFGSGRRICPGMSIGIATVEVSLANLLYKFDWEMPAGMKSDELDFEALTGLAMRKKNDLHLRARIHV